MVLNAVQNGAKCDTIRIKIHCKEMDNTFSNH